MDETAGEEKIELFDADVLRAIRQTELEGYFEAAKALITKAIKEEPEKFMYGIAFLPDDLPGWGKDEWEAGEEHIVAWLEDHGYHARKAFRWNGIGWEISLDPLPEEEEDEDEV